MGRARDVAVIIATFQGARTIATAVAAALAEPEAAEVIVVNDASPDDVEAAARGADDGTGRLKLLTLATNQGPAAARNAGFAATRSSWVTVLDDDDLYEPGRLKRLLDFDDDRWDFIADDLLLVSEANQQRHGTPMWFDERGAPTSLDLGQFVAGNIPGVGRERRELGFLKPLMRRAFLEAHGLRYGENLRLGEDYDLYARALASGARFLLTPVQGYVAVRRAGSLSAAHGQGELRALRDADTAILARYALTPDERRIVRRHRSHTDAKYRWQKLIDAVRSRSAVQFAAAFAGPPSTSLSLTGRLATEVCERMKRR